ncbi:Epidermal growth factor receptor [Frankliniella fusca]|uniref:Epidermal growth factor receptor n=1 Tax=Frankliniella fusca TaxID=407009 RepID=A0AAE1LCH9_9NEOP|nr:Epidermal growth factor receptor [Frankliniella fusca]
MPLPSQVPPSTLNFFHAIDACSVCDIQFLVVIVIAQMRDRMIVQANVLGKCLIRCNWISVKAYKYVRDHPNAAQFNFATLSEEQQRAAGGRPRWSVVCAARNTPNRPAPEQSGPKRPGLAIGPQPRGPELFGLGYRPEAIMADEGEAAVMSDHECMGMVDLTPAAVDSPEATASSSASDAEVAAAPAPPAPGPQAGLAAAAAAAPSATTPSSCPADDDPEPAAADAPEPSSRSEVSPEPSRRGSLRRNKPPALVIRSAETSPRLRSKRRGSRITDISSSGSSSSSEEEREPDEVLPEAKTRDVNAGAENHEHRFKWSNIDIDSSSSDLYAKYFFLFVMSEDLSSKFSSKLKFSAMSRCELDAKRSRIGWRKPDPGD